MKQNCYPCLMPDMITEDQAEVCEWQDNAEAKYLKEVSEQFIKNMKIPFGTYPKTIFFVRPFYNGHHEFKFISSITSDERAIELLKQKVGNSSMVGIPYSIIKNVAGQPQVIYRKQFTNSSPLTKAQKEFIIANDGTLEPWQIVKILNLSKWKVYNFRRRNGLVKSPVYHGNRKKQNIL